MLAVDSTFAVIDFETTGVVRPWPNEPWQVGLVRIEGGQVKSGGHFESLLRVGDRPFNPRAPGNHHRVRGQLAVAPTLQELWPVMHGWLAGRCLVAHNIGTERKMIRHLAPLHQWGPWVDTLKLARIAFPDLGSHTLEDLMEQTGLNGQVQAWCPGRQPHDALYDAYGCAALLVYMLGLPGWERVTVEQLAHAHPRKFHAKVSGRRQSRRGL
ncbi:MAG: 3'-5' exonuclease [Lentisphaerota bacterium]